MARSFVAAINQAPEIGSASTTFDADVPQIFVNIDGTRAETLGLSVGEIYSTIGANLGSRYVNDFTLQGRVYQVNLAAARTIDPPPRTFSTSMRAMTRGRWCR